MDDPALYHDELLEHAPALEQLSYYLTREEQSAHDLVQETMITALERPPRHRENLGGWLHTVARNLALRGHRTKRRRERRESEVARPESSGTPSPERDEIMTKVTRAVDELSEPYRTVIQMRFFDEMPPRMIAAELNRPIKTVKSQLHRGLGRLREALEKEFGDDNEIWAASLLAMILPKGIGGPAAAGTLSKETSTPFWNSMTFSLAALSAALAIVLVPLLVRPAPPSIEPLAIAQHAARLEAPDSDLSAAVTQEKESIGAPILPAQAIVSTNLQRVEARDCFGDPVRGGVIEVFRADGSFKAVGTTNADGLLTFEIDETAYVEPEDFHDDRPLPGAIDTPSLGIRLASDAYHSSSLVYWVPRGSNTTVRVETGRAPHFASGVALDGMGFPLGGVEIHSHKIDRPRFRTTGGHLATLSPNRVHTDAQGRFHMSGLPDSLYWLVATKEGFAPSYSRQSVFGAESTQVRFVMLEAASLKGRVTDKLGSPVPGARIQLLRDTVIEEQMVYADNSGNYEFKDLPSESVIELQAIMQGTMTTKSVTLERGEMRYFDFVLEPPPTSLAMQLTAPDGSLASDLSFEVVARYSSASLGNGIRKRKSIDVLTTNAQGFVTLPPQPALPESLTLFPLNDVGVRLPTPIASLTVPAGLSSRSHATLNVELRDMSRLSSLWVRVVDQHGQLLPDASIQARPLDGQSTLRCRRLPGEEGIWVRGAEPGRYALLAQNPKTGQAFLTEVQLKAGDVRHLGDLAVPARAVLRVDPQWWDSLPEPPKTLGAESSVPIQFELQQLSEWSGAPSNYSIFREPEPRVRYEVLPGRYALRRVHGRNILDEVLIDLDPIDRSPVATRE